MFVLVESLDKRLLDRPNLGISMLISSCREQGIATKLVSGQTRILKDIFVNDSEELWHLINGLGQAALEKLEILDYRQYMRQIGIRQFRFELKELYRKIIIDKSSRYYFNTPLIYHFEYLYSKFLEVYYYYLSELYNNSLKIIRHYQDEILKNNPSYIGFSLNSCQDPLLLHLIREIKKKTKIPIIIGGGFTPFMSLGNIEKFFLENCLDYLIIGQAEYALPRLIKKTQGINYSRIPNLVYRKNRKIEFNKIETIRNLDSLPFPDFSDFDLDLYLAPKKILPLQTARGCNWRKCAFCNYPAIYSDTYNTFSITKVIENILYLRKTYACQHIAFHDETIPAKRAELISKAIIKNGIAHQFFYGYARLEEKFNNSKTLSLMRKAGFSCVLWGVESGSQRVIDLMNKGVSVGNFAGILKRSSKNNIVNLCMGFFGFPGETIKEAQKTIDFLTNNSKYIDLIELQSFTLAGFSAIMRAPSKWGVTVGNDGGYTVQSGMDRQEAKLFLSNILHKLDVNDLKLSSGKITCVSDSRAGFYRIILSALSARLGIIPPKKIISLIRANKINQIYPIMPGEIKKMRGKTVFFPVRMNETITINYLYPQEKIFLTPLEEKILLLSDGTLSLEEVIENIYMEFKAERKAKRYFERKCKNFLQTLSASNLALAFTKPYFG